MNQISAKGRSPLCFALAAKADVHDIELLLSKGGSLNACLKHASPLDCMTHHHFLPPLKEDLVQLIVDKQACEDQNFEIRLQPVQNALIYCQYESAAIRLMLEQLNGNSVNTWIQQTNDALHIVVENNHCKPSIVELFLRRGACIDKLNAPWRNSVAYCFAN